MITQTSTVAVEVSHLTKLYRGTTALYDVSVSIPINSIVGLLGRNGAGKTTLMSMITAQNFATEGTVRIFGENPHENPAILQRMCFIREDQKYPDEARVRNAFSTARLFFPNWDEAFAQRLIADFDLPVNRRIKKLSRGQRSAVGVILGLASRTEITLFDEPYLGLDATARQIFYDRLLEDYTQHPRTIVLSSHLIDEIANLIEHVIAIDHGNIMINESTDSLRNRAYRLVGDASVIDAYAANKEVLHRDSLGSVSAVTIFGALDAHEKNRLTSSGVEIDTVSLQQLIVHLTEQKNS